MTLRFHISGYGRFYVIEIKTKLKLISLAYVADIKMNSFQNLCRWTVLSANCLVLRMLRNIPKLQVLDFIGVAVR